MKIKDKNFGFTLVELLVIMAIIGILSTAAVVNLRTAKAKARDAKRLSDIVQVQKALEVYYGINGHYPNHDGTGVLCRDLIAITACNSFYQGGAWIDEIGMTLPIDPINDVVSIDDYDSYTGVPLLYIYTRAASLSSDYGNYYYLLFRLEANDPIDRCKGNPWGSDWSCIGGGNLP